MFPLMERRVILMSATTAQPRSAFGKHNGLTLESKMAKAHANEELLPLLMLSQTSRSLSVPSVGTSQSGPGTIWLLVLNTQSVRYKEPMESTSAPGPPYLALTRPNAPRTESRTSPSAASSPGSSGASSSSSESPGPCWSPSPASSGSPALLGVFAALECRPEAFFEPLPLKASLRFFERFRSFSSCSCRRLATSCTCWMARSVALRWAARSSSSVTTFSGGGGGAMAYIIIL